MSLLFLTWLSQNHLRTTFKQQRLLTCPFVNTGVQSTLKQNSVALKWSHGTKSPGQVTALWLPDRATLWSCSSSSGPPLAPGGSIKSWSPQGQGTTGYAVLYLSYWQLWQVLTHSTPPTEIKDSSLNLLLFSAEAWFVEACIPDLHASGFGMAVRADLLWPA